MNRQRLACLLLGLATLLLYLPAQRCQFLFLDDPEYVVHNPTVQAGLTWPGVKWAFTTFHANNWHPLTWLSHMFDCQIFGADPAGPHLVNALLHTVNAALVFLLLARLTGSFWPALFAAALFAWHPLRVESVAWVAERKDVLSTFFGLLTLLCYVRFDQQRERRSYWLALLFFAVGLLTKPMLVTLPFVFLLLDWWPLRRNESSGPLRLVLEKIPFLLLSAGSCVLTFTAQREVSVMSLQAFPLPLRLMNVLTAYAGYLGKMVWPHNLAVFYPLSVKMNWAAVLAAVVVLALISGLAWKARRTRPYFLLGWLWYLGTLVPVIGLVQVGNQSMADRYTYLPMVGIIIALAYAVRDLTANGRIGFKIPAAAAGLLLAGCAVLTSRQLSCWHNNVSLFSHTVAATKDNVFAHMILGTALSREGRAIEAERNYREAIRIVPSNGRAHQNLATLLDELGRVDEAMAEYREALKLGWRIPEVHLAYGKRLAQAGQFNEAMEQFRDAALLRPGDAQPFYLMGLTRLREGRGLEAVIHFHKALRLDPNHVQTLTHLARLRATDNDSGVRYPEEALFMARRANDLTGAGQPFILDTLAAACAENGLYSEAETNVLKAISLSTNETSAVAAMQERLHLYRNHQPFRQATTNIARE